MPLRWKQDDNDDGDSEDENDCNNIRITPTREKKIQHLAFNFFSICPGF